jgi:hypothetical protein
MHVQVAALGHGAQQGVEGGFAERLGVGEGLSGAALAVGGSDNATVRHG